MSVQGYWYECGDPRTNHHQPANCEAYIQQPVLRECSHSKGAYHKTDKHKHLWVTPFGTNSGILEIIPRSLQE